MVEPASLKQEPQSFTAEHLDTFVRDGVLVVAGGVPSNVLHRACVSVNARLGRPNGITSFFESDGDIADHVRRPPSGHPDVALPLESAISGGPGDKEGVGRVGRDASQDPALLAVAKCPAVARLIAQLIGPGMVDTISGVQVALRFPGCNDALVVSGSAVRDVVGGSDWHTDGNTFISLLPSYQRLRCPLFALFLLLITFPFRAATGQEALLQLTSGRCLK
jgi:hypothetical protein